MKRFYIALGLSLLFHIIQYIAVNLAPSLNLLSGNDETIVEIVETLDEQKKQFQKQIVPIPKVKSLTNQDPAKFFSENDQRVEKETATKNLGVTKNQNSEQKVQTKKTEKNVPVAEEPEFAKAVRQGTTISEISALEFKLPSDIAEGTATNLNTDAHIYASFYNRVTELFYIRWAQRLDAIWERMPEETKKNLSGRVWQTDIEVWLKSTGEYSRSFIMKPSGFQNFDNAAAFAFQNARFFPNPPRAKVEADGFVRLRYRIAVHVR